MNRNKSSPSLGYSAKKGNRRASDPLFGVLNQYAAGLEMNADNTVMTFTDRDEADRFAKQYNDEDAEGWRSQGLEAKRGPCFQVKPLDQHHRIIEPKLKPSANTLGGWADIIHEQGERDDAKRGGRLAKNAALGEARDDIVKAAIAFINNREFPRDGKCIQEEAELAAAVEALEKIVDV